MRQWFDAFGKEGSRGGQNFSKNPDLWKVAQSNKPPLLKLPNLQGRSGGVEQRVPEVCQARKELRELQ
ncbi:MAG: hypothetical protein U5L45_19340 [Saprospiraceae bacterium]|nr:hypothetical protein [Saprospiraceae bacterium]